MKDRYKYDGKKMQHINSKSWNVLMQHDSIMNCWFIYQKNIYILLRILSLWLRVWIYQCSTSLLLTETESKVSQLLPSSSIILKIFSKSLTPKEQRKLILTRFSLVKILSSVVLETGAVKNNLADIFNLWSDRSII